MLDQRGGVGFAVFIVAFILYAVFTVVYFEAIVEEDPQLQEEVAEIVPEPVEKGPEVTLPTGTVISLPATEPLVLLTRTDVSQLPEDTPTRFVNYMRNTLPLSEEESKPGCITAYQISKISNFNMSGSIGEVNKNTGRSDDICTKGLSVVWYVDEVNWTWVSKNFGVLPTCEELSEIPVYSEFIAECQRQSDEEVLDNPNGSIKNREEA